MSYNPNRQGLSEFISAWNSTNDPLPAYNSPQTSLGFILDLDTIGEGDSTISTNAVTVPEQGLQAFFMADLRSDSVSGVVSGDLYEIHFASSDGDFSSGGQVQRANRNDDQCYGLGASAKIEIDDAFRISGNTLAPWVRVLGVLWGK